MRMGIILLYMMSFLQGTAQVIPAGRLVDWTRAGYPAPIPDPSLVLDATDFGAVGDSLTDNAQALASAIDYLDGKRGVVFFPPGQYIFNSPVNLNDSLVIRGTSSDQTHFIFDLDGAAENCFNISRSQSEEFVEVSEGFEKGSKKLIVEDPDHFQANTYAEIRQENGEWDTEPISWAAYSVGQILFIEDIIGDTLLLKNALRIDYEDELDPEIRPLDIIRETGIECFKITRADNTVQGVGYNFYLAFAVNCWIRGIESHYSVGSHIYLTQSSGIGISGCYIHDAYAYDGSGTRGYGITLNMHSGGCLIENNILRRLRHAMMVKTGANGNVFAYNYSIEPMRSEPIHDFSGDISLHGHYAFANLFEGNIVQNIIIDHYWGPPDPGTHVSGTAPNFMVS
ncbi:MAG: glycosyl hydrolase family 28-related protein [Bacteroidota bacterium]|nr:glycosyl hydrolase family 28-related protein [Bacteroidota bacterium]